MTKWNDISTVEYIQRDSFRRSTRDLLFWVESEYVYKGPIIGIMTEYTRKDGSSLMTFHADGFCGHDIESNFSAEEITHWAELPEGPK